MDIYNPVHTPTFASVGFDNFLGKALRGLVGYEIEKLTNQNVLGFPVPTALNSCPLILSLRNAPRSTERLSVQLNFLLLSATGRV